MHRFHVLSRCCVNSVFHFTFFKIYRRHFPLLFFQMRVQPIVSILRLRVLQFARHHTKRLNTFHHISRVVKRALFLKRFERPILLLDCHCTLKIVYILALLLNCKHLVLFINDQVGHHGVKVDIDIHLLVDLFAPIFFNLLHLFSVFTLCI